MAYQKKNELRSVKPQPAQHNKPRGGRRKRTCLICFGSCFLLLVLVVVVLLIVAFTVFKPKNTQLHVDSVVVEDFHSRIILNLPPTILLNVTLGLLVSVRNPNKVGFKYYNSTAHMFYRNKEVAVAPIPSGELGPRDTKQVSSSLYLQADRLTNDPRVYQDYGAGSLPFSTTSRISGKLDILHIFKHHVDMSSICNFNVSVANLTYAINNMVCSDHYSL